jgi:beta-lactamase regulating signal transducer with metallopeptidase domain
MNKSIWKEHALTHRQTSEFVHASKEKPHTPWHQLEKKQRREIIEYKHTCKNYTKIILGFFVVSIVAASIVTVKNRTNPEVSSQQEVEFIS